MRKLVFETSVERLAVAASLTAAGRVELAMDWAKARVEASSSGRFFAVNSAAAQASGKRVQ